MFVRKRTDSELDADQAGAVDGVPSWKNNDAKPGSRNSLSMRQRSFGKVFTMTSLRTTVTVAIVFSLLSACAQTPVGQASAGPGAVATVSDKRMAMMDMQMKSMRDMHEKMMRARSPEERSALKSEHAKLMRDGMAMMGGMGPDGMSGMKGMHGMGAMPGGAPAPGDMAIRQEMMEKHMAMMQSMMQMMMDQMPPEPVKP